MKHAAKIGILVVTVAWSCAGLAAESRIVFTKPSQRWLWGGFGFHNSEATMTPLMSDEFRDQRVLKTFHEISPTYARVFAGYWDWTREAMDRFADYYDATFRRAGTTLYLVPGRMPVITDNFKASEYCEAVATRLEYLVRERKCTKIRYYCLSEEKARYDVARFSGFGLDVRYNKNGLFRWCDDDRDYSSYPDLYTMGYLAKLFRKGARVLPWTTDDDTLRAGGVTNLNGSVSFAVVNWGDAKKVTLAFPLAPTRPLRVYEYDSEHPPINAFNDLQPAKGTVMAVDGAVTVAVPAKSMTFLTTDYEDRVPAAVVNGRIANGVLSWTASKESEHCYYRVYRDGTQIASTVATSLPVPGVVEGDLVRFSVKSVDKWGNVGK